MSLILLLRLSVAVMLVHSATGSLPRRGPKRPTAVAVRKQLVEGQESDGGYPCSVTCPSPNYVYSLSLIDSTESRLFRIASNGSVSARNVSDVFEAAASTEVDNSSGIPSCRDKLQDWVLEWWRGSCHNVPSRLLDVIEYEVNREYSPLGGESHWQCDPRSFSFLPFKALVRVSGNRGLEWERTDESRQGMPNLPQISAGTSEPRVAGKKKKSPKRKISKLGGSTLWINNPFVTTLWAMWKQDHHGDSKWDPCLLRATTRQQGDCYLGLLAGSSRTYVWCENYGQTGERLNVKDLSDHDEYFTVPNVYGKCYGRLVAFLQAVIRKEARRYSLHDRLIDAFYKAIESDLDTKDDSTQDPFEITSPDTIVSYALELLHAV
ncbi:hypothetical protein FOZ63_033318 [Perkinsus olseni]|uniref:Uncharacterized protein n=2 Tax=Perkinsus olseni TaxID=32597 RepID=A0A7J6Q907_PEROL|nr:hypothetical protein FOZ63_033318 [Perkinsus olseni]